MDQIDTVTQMQTNNAAFFEDLAFDYRSEVIGQSRILHADCFN